VRIENPIVSIYSALLAASNGLVWRVDDRWQQSFSFDCVVGGQTESKYSRHQRRGNFHTSTSRRA
jgi:hypothetical protein